jgi:hypothetical protein
VWRIGRERLANTQRGNSGRKIQALPQRWRGESIEEELADRLSWRVHFLVIFDYGSIVIRAESTGTVPIVLTQRSRSPREGDVRNVSLPLSLEGALD